MKRGRAALIVTVAGVLAAGATTVASNHAVKPLTALFQSLAGPPPRPAPLPPPASPYLVAGFAPAAPVQRPGKPAQAPPSIHYLPAIGIPACAKDYKIVRLTVAPGIVRDDARKKPAAGEDGPDDSALASRIDQALVVLKEVWTKTAMVENARALNPGTSSGAALIAHMLEDAAKRIQKATTAEMSFRVGIAAGMGIANPVPDEYSLCRTQGQPPLPELKPFHPPKPPRGTPDPAR